MFYEDLTPYGYADEGDLFDDLTDGMHFVGIQPRYERLNVGWLESGRPWASSPTPPDFVDRLVAILDAQQINVMLGLHECDLCPAPLPASHP